MCIFCEEPFRSVMFGLAAIGLIVVVRSVWKQIAQRTQSARDAGAPRLDVAT